MWPWYYGRYEYADSGLGLGAAGVKFVGLTAQELEEVDDAAFMVIKDKVRRLA